IWPWFLPISPPKTVRSIAVKEAEELPVKNTSASPALKASLNMLMMVVKMLSDRLGLNSLNSSKPPASDLNRKKRLRSKK
ncbi:DUF6444 domain-containing protein, partial [Microbulbifer sp. OS29]